MSNEPSQPVFAAPLPTGKCTIELPACGVELEEVERELVRQALERAAGNQTRAAELLGIKRDALRRRLQKFNLLN